MMVISNMLDCEEVFEESINVVMKVMLMLEFDAHQIFKATLVSQLNANPICPRIGFYELKIQSTSITTMTTSTPPPRPLACWLNWDMMWASICV